MSNYETTIICPYCKHSHSKKHTFIFNHPEETVTKEFRCWECSKIFWVQVELVPREITLVRPD